jgi:hypothetical protein
MTPTEPEEGRGNIQRQVDKMDGKVDTLGVKLDGLAQRVEAGAKQTEQGFTNVTNVIGLKMDNIQKQLSAELRQSQQAVSLLTENQNAQNARLSGLDASQIKQDKDIEHLRVAVDKINGNMSKINWAIFSAILTLIVGVALFFLTS